MQTDDSRSVRRTDTDRGTVVMLERLCAVGNRQACETLERLCDDDGSVACRSVRDA
jgi:hypothetical protein